MRNGALMPESNEYEPARLVDGICHAFPPRGLFRVVDPRGSIPSLSLFADEGTLRNDKPCPGPLRVILGHQLVRDLPAVVSPGARQRRHDDAILELQVAER